ncbi:MAG: helicase-exonuclease AddAB subunit AddA [Ruminococcus callidus]|nr:helicase-exonuclease AddAB subunit AddA [Ruminococcus callidus]
MAWTTEQQQAISHRNSSLIVSAAAGSGKTSVLVERLIQLLSDPEQRIYADRMIVVTFTNDAAAEMKQRLQAALEKRIASEPENRWLRQQQLILPAAKISTINAFCFDLIREYAGDREITSSFRVMDETEQEILCRETMDEVLNRWYAERPEAMQQLWNAFCSGTDKALEEILMELKTFLGSIPFPAQWKQQVLQSVAKPYQESSYYRDFLSLLQEDAARIADAVEQAYQLAETLYDGENNVADWIGVDFDTMHALLHALQKETVSVEQVLKIIQNHEDLRKGKRYPSKKKTVSSVEQFEQVKEQRKAYKEEMDTLFQKIKKTLPYCAVDLQAHQELLPFLFALTEEVEQILWEKKTECNALSFEDGERLVLQLLAEEQDGTLSQSPLARTLSEYYQIIMIDEYQDANNKQDMIFKLLSHACRKDEHGTLLYGDNVFLVGDVKQSIYQFRLANPKNFIQCVREAELEKQHSAAPMMQCIKLNQNFRSSKQVLQFVNLIFSEIMGEGSSEIVYDKSEWLYAGSTSYDHLPAEQQGTQIAFLQESDTVDMQAAWIAHTIQEMLQSGYPVAERDGSTRPCHAGDFCILLRKGKPCQKYAKALEALQIPVKKVEEQGYLRAREITILLNMLRILDNPLLEVPLTAVMVSPMFQFSMDEIATLRLLDRHQPLYLVLSAVADAAGSPATPELLEAARQLPESFQEKCHSFWNIVQALRKDSTVLSLEDLIREVYDTTDFLSVMQLYQDGEKKRANLNLLIQYARQYEAQGQASFTGGVTGFLRYIDSLLENERDLEQANPSNGADRAVFIKTMHRSKGLEFPFVFLAELETRFSTQDSRKKLHVSDSGRMGLYLYDAENYEKYSTLPYLVLLQEKQKQLVQEEMRLLYVAMTRAKQKLFLPLTVSKSSQSWLEQLHHRDFSNPAVCSHTVQSVGSMAQWIWYGLFRRQDAAFIQEFPEQQCMYQLKKDAPDFADLHIQYTYVTEKNLEETLPLQMSALPQPNAALQAEIETGLQFHYDTTASKQLSLMSVSNLSHNSGQTEPEAEMSWNRPRFLQRGQLTASERGTATHAFLQYVSFTEAEKSPETALQTLIQNGYLTKQQADSIRLSDLQRFFQSELYQRIRCSPMVLREKKFLVQFDLLQQRMQGEEWECLKQQYNPDSMVKGIIDLAFWEQNGFVLVDYKTDATKDMQLLADRYRMQLHLYQLALEGITGKTVRQCCLFSTYTGNVVLL